MYIVGYSLWPLKLFKSMLPQHCLASFFPTYHCPNVFTLFLGLVLISLFRELMQRAKLSEKLPYVEK